MLHRMVALFMLAACAGCHHIKSDYPAYLESHHASPALPRVSVITQYQIAPATLEHRIVIRSGAAGQGNKWIVELGRMLEQTMQSSEVRAAFAGLTRQTGVAAAPEVHRIRFELVDYRVIDFSARLAVRVVLAHGSATLVDKIYRSEGAAQAGKVWWGGAFAMREALQASTKHALDAVLREFLIDMQRTLAPSHVVACAH